MGPDPVAVLILAGIAASLLGSPRPGARLASALLGGIAAAALVALLEGPSTRLLVALAAGAALAWLTPLARDGARGSLPWSELGGGPGRGGRAVGRF